jgi:hypothetical protein
MQIPPLHAAPRERRCPATLGPAAALLGVLLLALTACRSSRHRLDDDPDHLPPDQTYFTQFTLHHERDVVRTTNYRRGAILPVNSEATLLSMDRNRITVHVPAMGRRLVVENVARHTDDDVRTAFDKVFGMEPVDLDRFSEEHRHAIREGRVVPGMDKDAVTAALGHPPRTGTPSLESNDWRYWQTRWNTFVVRFGEDGTVTEIVH